MMFDTEADTTAGSSDAGDVAARLRDKIRSQAAELLLKVDTSYSRTSTSSRLTSTTSPPQSPRKPTKHWGDDDDEGDAANDDDKDSEGGETEDASSEDEDSSENASVSESQLQSSADLTKRLQKLALERQKQTKADRLKVIQSDQSSHLSSVKTFQELNLPEHLLRAIFEMGFDRPSAIQEEALPRILADPPRDLIGQAQSGSGKTTCFTLGMLYRITVDAPATTQALCVTPTRELAIQIVEKAVQPMGAHMKGLKVQLAVSKATLSGTGRNLAVRAHLVVGTPGKVVDWIKRRFLQTNRVKVFVLDEADNMVGEGGHRANSLLIQRKLPAKCQKLLFSATFPTEVLDFCSKMIDKPDKILLSGASSGNIGEDGSETGGGGPADLVLDEIKQLWIDTREYQGGSPLEFLADIYSLLTIGQSIVFVASQNEADTVHTTLENAGYTCSVLHAGVEPDQRDDTMRQFRRGVSNVLITTNVLARGVDVDNVCLVVNYNVPTVAKDHSMQPDYETYLHRIGRTGRFGRKGTAITFVSNPQQLRALQDIEKHFTAANSTKALMLKAPADPEALADLIEI